MTTKVVRQPRGTTQESDAYTGPSGQITVDVDRLEIRLHDGATPGGIRILGLEQLLTIFRASADDPLGEDLPEAGLGIIVRIADGAYTVREITTTLGGIVITNPTGVGGNFNVALDIDGMDEGAPDIDTDSFPAWDESVEGNVKVIFKDFFGLITQFPALADIDATADYLYVYDASTSLAKKSLVIDLFRSIADLTEETSPGPDDYIVIRKASNDTARKVEIASLAGGAPHVILAERQNSGVAGGTFTIGADRTRVLNTEVMDTLDICSLAGNQFTLAAGTYYIEWSPPAFFVETHQSMLYDVTALAVIARGMSMLARNGTANGYNTSEGFHTFTIAAPNVYEIRHRCGNTQAGNGFGAPCSFGQETYTVVKIWKLA